MTIKKEKELFQETNSLLNDFTSRNIGSVNATITNNLKANTINTDLVNTNILNMTGSGAAICFGYGVSGNTLQDKCIAPADIVNVKNLGSYITSTESGFNTRLAEVRGKCNSYNTVIQNQLRGLTGTIQTSSTNTNEVERRLTTLESATANRIDQFNSQINTINSITIPDITKSVQGSLIDMSSKCGGISSQINSIKSEFESRIAKLEKGTA